MIINYIYEYLYLRMQLITFKNKHKEEGSESLQFPAM